MTTVQQKRPAVKAKPPATRAHRWKLGGPRGPLVLEILTCKPRVSELSRYAFSPLATDEEFGPAFRLEKIDAAGSPAGESYDVNLAGHGSCECLGFLRHGRCKHLQTGYDMLAAGEIGGAA